MLQISSQGGQGGWGHQDCPRLRPREREDRADAGAAGQNNDKIPSFHLIEQADIAEWKTNY